MIGYIIFVIIAVLYVNIMIQNTNARRSHNDEHYYEDEHNRRY